MLLMNGNRPVLQYQIDDLYIKVIIQTPSRLSQKEKNLYEELEKLEGASTSPKLIKLSEIGK